MLLIPAIDLKDGKCVRLRQGRMSEAAVFSDDPVEMAGRWVNVGCKRLHLIDLNGAFEGKPVNAAAIHRICTAWPDVPIQVGGGIRTETVISTYLDAGVSWVIIGTQAVKAPDFVPEMCRKFPGHIIVGLDARDGKVAVEGWAEISDHDATNLARDFENDGVDAIIYTDIARDGMMKGVNVDATRRLAEAVDIPVIASGGVSCYQDISDLQAVSHCGIIGTIIGRALYEGTIDLEHAQKIVNKPA